MTSGFSQNWKILAGAAIAAVLLGGVFSFGMFTPKAEASHISTSACTVSADGTILTWIHHWDKIIFQILRDPNNPPIVPTNLLKTPLDIKVGDNPNEIADLDQKIRDFLSLHLVPGAVVDPLLVDQLKIDIIDVEYAIVCTSEPPLP